MSAPSQPPPEVDALTAEFAAVQRALSARTAGDAVKLWPVLDLRALPATYGAWSDAMATVINRDRAISAAFAAKYTTDVRAAYNVSGSFPPVLSPVVPAEQMRIALSGSSIGVFYKGQGVGLTDAAAARNALVQVVGSASRLAINGGRATVQDTVAKDPKAYGWQRVSDGNPCAFCALLISRGPIYKGKGSAFKAHDHCNCTAQPVYGPKPPLSDQAEQFDQIYRSAAKGQRDKLNAFRRAYERPGS